MPRAFLEGHMIKHWGSLMELECGWAWKKSFYFILMCKVLSGTYITFWNKLS